MDELESLRRELEGAHADLVATIHEAVGEEAYRRPAENEWSVAEILAHTGEWQRYYASQVIWVRDHPDSPFGRSHDAPERLGAVAQRARDPLGEALAWVESGQREVLRAVATLKEEHLANLGHHPRRGTVTLRQLIQTFLIGHKRNHTQQIRQTLQAVREGGPTPRNP